MNAGQISGKMWGVLVLISLLVCGCQDNPLGKYGIGYSVSSGESESLKKVYFFRNTNNGRICGPEIVGTELQVSFRKSAGEDMPVAIVTSKTFPTYRTVIKVNLSPTASLPFEIIENVGLNINYPKAGYIWP